MILLFLKIDLHVATGDEFNDCMRFITMVFMATVVTIFTIVTMVTIWYKNRIIHGHATCHFFSRSLKRYLLKYILTITKNIFGQPNSQELVMTSTKYNSRCIYNHLKLYGSSYDYQIDENIQHLNE